MINRLKKTNISSVVSSIVLLVFIMQQKEMFSDAIKQWVDLFLEWLAFGGLGSITLNGLGLIHKYKKGEPIILEKRK